MPVEDVLIAKICHDLITPCNAINLGIEAYELSEDRSLLLCIKDSALKANVVLKFMRELFITRDQKSLCSVDYLRKLVSEFLGIYNIGCSFVTNYKDLDPVLGRIILFDSAVMHELMPIGGKVVFSINEDCISVTYSGNSIIELDALIPRDLTYRNILRFKLLEQLKMSGFSVSSSIKKGEGRILERRIKR